MNSNELPIRRTADLRKGRLSLPGARYFITCSTIRPQTHLTDIACARPVLDTFHRLEQDADIILSCATIMPDHLHLLLAITGRLSIARIVAKLKTLTHDVLARHNIGWQANYFEHRLRPEDAANPYAMYIFLNPYRAGLISRQSVWPWWIRGEQADFDFLSHLEMGQFPPSEWLSHEPKDLGLSLNAVGKD
jgi:REP element-mobilizing transposase RayT